MKREQLDVVRGSGNVFRDLGHKNADAEQFKAILAAEMIKSADFSRNSQCGPGAVHGRSPYVNHQPFAARQE
jgi:hypothetical protein